jgi:hypothetical protein
VKRLRSGGRHSGASALALTAAEIVVASLALADAAGARTAAILAPCLACEADPDGACGPHLADLERLKAYEGLARQFAAFIPAPAVALAVIPEPGR